MEKGAYVKDIIEGNTAEGIFVATDASLLQSRAGDPYWALKLQDASGSIDCKIWKPLSQKFTEIPQGSIVRASGRAGSFRDQMQLEISGMTILDEESAAGIPPAWIMPSSPHDLDEMLEELCALCKEEFVHRPWARLAGKVLNDAEYRAFFRVWPAARVMHQAYAGGLLEHTLQVFRICRQIADLYPELDRQTLLAGALFHDFGKIREFSGGLSNVYTTDGLLVGHIVLGVQMLAPFLAKSDLEEHLQQHLTHLILSHHGQLEFNAVTLPQTAEAFALHMADDLDSKMGRCRSMFSKFAESESGWVAARESKLGRAMFKALKTPAACAKERKNFQREECLSLLKV